MFYKKQKHIGTFLAYLLNKRKLKKLEDYFQYGFETYHYPLNFQLVLNHTEKSCIATCKQIPTKHKIFNIFVGTCLWGQPNWN